MAWHIRDVAESELDDVLPPVVVLTALNSEHKAMRKHLTEIRPWQHPAGTIFHEGTLAGSQIPVVLAIAGEGNQATAVLTERANTQYGPLALLFVGVAGSLKDDIGLGDIVVATRVYAIHGGKESAAGFQVRSRSWDAPPQLEQLARNLDVSGEWTQWLPANARACPPPVHFGPVAAGEVVLNSRDSPLAKQLQGNYNDAVAIEMESAGAAHAGHLGALSVLTIRAISDLADGDKHAADKSGSQRSASTHAAAFAAALIGSIEMPPSSARALDSSAALSRRSLPEPLPTTWLPQLSLPRTAGRAMLELHLIPAGSDGQVPASRLIALATELVALGRGAGLFGPGESLSGSEPATVTSATGHGLAVTPGGQRSAWQPLPADTLGAVLDAGDITDRLAILLDVVLRMETPRPALAGLAVGVTHSVPLSEGSVPDLPRRTTRLRTSMLPLRVQAADAFPYARLGTDRQDVAAELTARLFLAFRRLTG